MNKTTLILGWVLLFLLPFENKAQDISVLLKEAQQYEARFNDQEALQKYSQILRHQPNNIQALCKASELHALVGRRLPTKEKQVEYYKLARSYAQQALKINPNLAEANFVMSFALGRIALIASGDERINAVKDIKNYAEKTIRLDPLHYKGYHVLGKWHYEVSNLNALEKWLLKVAYGSLPPSSLEMAIRNFEKSAQLNPSFLLNYLELARSYDRKDERKKAIELLNTMIKLPLTTSNDASIKASGKKLLEKLQ
jgi:tetratricopeptide (TPR) repeat protein